MNALGNLQSFGSWPVWVGLVVLVAAAWMNHRWGRIPNQATFGAIGAAWAVAAFLAGFAPTTGGSLASSVICTFAALAALAPAYALGCMPAGCVKAQMAFGAWLGCGLGLGPALTATVVATIAGQLATAAAVSIYQLRQRSLVQAGDEPVDYSRPPDLFPIQTTLTVGSLLGIAVAFGLRFVG
jgi:Flp pilus assembly protein protease CpaA